MPVGSGAVTDLLPTPEQRTAIYRRIREFRSTKPIFSMDFQNDAEYVCPGRCGALCIHPLFQRQIHRL